MIIALLFVAFALVTLLAAFRIASDADDHAEICRDFKEEK